MSDNYFVENEKKCPPRMVDAAGDKSTNLCVKLRRKAKWKGYAILPDEAFYPKGVPDATMQTRRNSGSDIPLSDKPSNVSRRERYANDPDYRDAHKVRTRRNYKSNPVPRKRSKHKKGYDRAYWLRNRENINAKRRERYANDPIYREAHLSKQREGHKARKEKVEKK